QRPDDGLAGRGLDAQALARGPDGAALAATTAQAEAGEITQSAEDDVGTDRLLHHEPGGTAVLRDQPDAETERSPRGGQADRAAVDLHRAGEFLARETVERLEQFGAPRTEEAGE